MTRKALSARTRFEIFKRDKFICQYCGAHPPAVILHVDHIKAVANGGTNAITNLVTACERCNLGKSAVPLEFTRRTLKAESQEIAEREAQLHGYHEIVEAQRNRLEQQAWDIAEILYPDCKSTSLQRSILTSIKRFLEQLDYYSVLDAMEMAVARIDDSQYAVFRYFCGICWRTIRGGDGQNKTA